MTKEEFWEKWQPTDWPALDCEDKKKEFMTDLEKVIQEETHTMATVQETQRKNVQLYLSTIVRSMEACRNILRTQLTEETGLKTEIAIRKSFDNLKESSKALWYYRGQLDVEHCCECGHKLREDEK